MGSIWSRDAECAGTIVLRKKVNDMLATGASYAMIVRALGEDNAELDKRDRVTIDSVRNHCGRHFPVQNVAQATYREILERRARENESTSSKAWPRRSRHWRSSRSSWSRRSETLVDVDTEVSVETGMRAARSCSPSSTCGTDSRDLLVLKVQLDRIGEAVRAVVPQEMWAEIIEKLEELEQHSEALDVGTDSFDDADDEPYDPTEFIDEDDEF